LELIQVEVSRPALESLKTILRDKFGVNKPIECVYRVSGGGINDDGHRVAQTRSGRRFGIKTKNRGAPDGARREATFSDACRILGLEEACRAVCVDSVPGLDGFETQCVVTEWLPASKQAGEVSAEGKKELEARLETVAHTLGRWVAANLLLGLADRGGLKNWVWSQAEFRLVAIDAESAFGGASVQDHHSIIDAFYGRLKLKAEKGASPAAIAFENGLKVIHAAFRAQKDAIIQLISSIPSISAYVSLYAQLSEDDFVHRVFSELG